MLAFLTALTAADAKKIAIGVVVVVILGGYTSFKVTKTIVQKAISLGITVALIALVWSQRQNMSDCAQRVRDQMSTSLQVDTSCTFFGKDVTVKR
ncbi:MAG: hypothetical protein R2705_03785 [Ilumatobacteraceae bacterium]